MEPFHFFAGERLSEAELSAACLDGDLTALGDAYVPAGAAETVWMRARALGPLLGPTLAATHTTAAWVHGALCELPTRLDVQRCSERRRHHVPQRRFVYRDMRLDPDDTVLIAGIAVSTPARTAADLARGGEAYSPVLRALIAWRPELVEAASAWLLAHAALPRVRDARARLMAAAEHRRSDVTRVTS